MHTFNGSRCPPFTSVPTVFASPSPFTTTSACQRVERPVKDREFTVHALEHRTSRWLKRIFLWSELLDPGLRFYQPCTDLHLTKWTHRRASISVGPEDHLMALKLCRRTFWEESAACIRTESCARILSRMAGPHGSSHHLALLAMALSRTHPFQPLPLIDPRPQPLPQRLVPACAASLYLSSYPAVCMCAVGQPISKVALPLTAVCVGLQRDSVLSRWSHRYQHHRRGWHPARPLHDLIQDERQERREFNHHADKLKQTRRRHSLPTSS